MRQEEASAFSDFLFFIGVILKTWLIMKHLESVGATINAKEIISSLEFSNSQANK